MSKFYRFAVTVMATGFRELGLTDFRSAGAGPEAVGPGARLGPTSSSKGNLKKLKLANTLP